jgi:hypothetical protein
MRIPFVVTTIVTALALGAMPSGASALATGGNSCGDQVPGAYWTAVDGHILVPDARSVAGKSWPRYVSNRWSVSYEPDQGGPPASQDCQQLADPIASTDSTDTVQPGDRTGPDGSNCHFDGAAETVDHGSAWCDNGSITVSFAPAVQAVENPSRTDCPKVRAPRPPHDTSSQRRFYFHPTVYGTSCSEARRVIPRVWRVPVRPDPSDGGLYRLMVIRTAPSSTHGLEWYCAVDLGSDRSDGKTLVTGEDVCAEAARVSGFGLVQFGPKIAFSIM